MSGKPDPRPEKRIVANAEDWEKIRATLRWECVGCGELWLPALSTHHIVGKDAGGDDVVENLVVLCGYTEARPNGCHVVLQERRNGWEAIAARVRMYVMARDSRTSYVRKKLGSWERFTVLYPLPILTGIGDYEAFRSPDRMLQANYK